MTLRLALLILIILVPGFALAFTEAEIQGFIDEAIKAGGGEVVIPPGVHQITKGLEIKDAKNLRLAGLDTEITILKLPPLAYAEVAEDVPAGSASIAVTRQQNVSPGTKLHIESDGEIDSFTGKPKPYQLAELKAVEGNRLVLRQPLKFTVKAKTLIRDANAPNLIKVLGASEGVSIEKLTLDGGRAAGDPTVHGHVQLCGILATGPYSYEKGPTGPRVKGLQISRCIIQNCHGRGVALYSVEEAVIAGCTIMDTTDEAIDLDHFTRQTVVRHNNVTRCPVGVELNDANDCLVSANEFLECATGINLWRWCRQEDLNKGNRIENNLFSRSKGNAIQFGKNTTANSIVGNDIEQSGRNGISLSGKDQVVAGNRISGSQLKDIAILEGEHKINVTDAKSATEPKQAPQ